MKIDSIAFTSYETNTDLLHKGLRRKVSFQSYNKVNKYNPSSLRKKESIHLDQSLAQNQRTPQQIVDDYVAMKQAISHLTKQNNDLERIIRKETKFQNMLQKKLGENQLYDIPCVTLQEVYLLLQNRKLQTMLQQKQAIILKQRSKKSVTEKKMIQEQISYAFKQFLKSVYGNSKSIKQKYDQFEAQVLVNQSNIKEKGAKIKKLRQTKQIKKKQIQKIQQNLEKNKILLIDTKKSKDFKTDQLNETCNQKNNGVFQLEQQITQLQKEINKMEAGFQIAQDQIIKKKLILLRNLMDLEDQIKLKL